jgi:hypothetical protein
MRKKKFLPKDFSAGKCFTRAGKVTFVSLNRIANVSKKCRRNFVFPPSMFVNALAREISVDISLNISLSLGFKNEVTLKSPSAVPISVFLVGKKKIIKKFYLKKMIFIEKN